MPTLNPLSKANIFLANIIFNKPDIWLQTVSRITSSSTSGSPAMMLFTWAPMHCHTLARNIRLKLSGVNLAPLKIGQQFYSVFQGFRQAKIDNGGSILTSSQFLILPQLPRKMKLASKVVKVDSKIIILLPKI